MDFAIRQLRRGSAGKTGGSLDEMQDTGAWILDLGCRWRIGPLLLKSGS